MDQYLSTVIIALITGTFSVITLLIQKKQDKVIDKIDEQTMFIEKEKVLKQKLTQKEKERELLLHKIMILILDTNLCIIKNTNIGHDANPANDAIEQSGELKDQFNAINHEIDEITKEYEMVLNLTSEFQEEFDKKKNKRSKDNNK